MRLRPVRWNMAGNQPKLLQRQRFLDFQCRAQVAEMDRIERTPQDADHAVRNTREQPADPLNDKVAPARPSAADVSVTENDELQRGEPFQTNRAARMQLVGADADLGAEPVFEAVREAGRGIDHD